MEQTDEGAETPASVPDDSGATRRERQRQVTLAEITEAAQRQLTTEGARGFSLRAVARDIGLAPSAIYRYFDSQTALVATVAVQASQVAGEQMRQALDAAPAGSVADRLIAVLSAYRSWALNHAGEFELLFATDQTLLADVSRATDPSWFHRLYEIPLEVLLEAGDGPEVSEESSTPALSAAPQAGSAPRLAAPAVALLQELEHRRGHPISEERCIALISAWASVHGYVALERCGQLGLVLTDPEPAFAAHLDQVVAQLLGPSRP